MKPTAKERDLARKVLGSDWEQIYIANGLATRLPDGAMQLSRLGEIAIVCARLIEGLADWTKQPYSIRGEPFFWLRDGSYIVTKGPWLTAKGKALAALTGLKPAVAIPAPKSGTRLIEKRAA
jgi:hypothetical protein